MRKTITLKLTPDLRARLEKYCEKRDRSASWVIKTLIEDSYNFGDFTDVKKFKGVSEKLTISIPEKQWDDLGAILDTLQVKLQDFIRTEIYHLTKGRKYK
jgi:predicted DNA-binding protein